MMLSACCARGKVAAYNEKDGKKGCHGKEQPKLIAQSKRRRATISIAAVSFARPSSTIVIHTAVGAVGFTAVVTVATITTTNGTNVDNATVVHSRRRCYASIVFSILKKTCLNDAYCGL